MIGLYLFIVFILIVYGYLLDPFLSISNEEDGIKRSDLFIQHCIVSIVFPLVLVLLFIFKIIKKLFKLVK